MNRTQQLQSIAVAALVVLAAVTAFTYTSIPKSAPESEQTHASVTLTIEGFATPFSMPIHEGETALAVLKARAVEDPDFEIGTKEYAGLGTLVESIGGMKNGTDGKYWQYKVNGVMPQVGAETLILHDGDSIEWFFATSGSSL